MFQTEFPKILADVQQVSKA